MNDSTARPGNVHDRGPIRGFWDTEYLYKRLQGYEILKEKIKGIFEIDIPGRKFEFQDRNYSKKQDTGCLSQTLILQGTPAPPPLSFPMGPNY